MSSSAAGSTVPDRSERWFERRSIHVALAVAIGAVGLFALHALAREVTWAQLTAALDATPPRDIALAFAFTASSFVALALYDVAAVRVAAPGRVPVRVAALAGAAGYAMSNTLGFALLTGGTLRARIYGAHGLDARAVAGVLATSWLTFWMGVATAAGAMLLIDPTGPAARLGLSPAVDRAVGAALVLLVLALLAWLAWQGRRGEAPVVTVRGRTVRLPTARLALAQTAIALLDIGSAAMALWVLLPASVDVGPAAFFVAYVAAVVIGIASHSPGGLGAFEATLLAALGLGGDASVLAALILYRLVYYVLPFVVAAIGIAFTWWRGHREGAAARAQALSDLAAPLVPPLAAGLCVLAGAVLLFSGALPATEPRTEALRLVAPLAVIESSHLVGSALGAALIVLARGLLRRREAAWRWAIAALALGAVASLLKGLDWVEAGLMGLGIVLLLAFRSAFYRGGGVGRVTPGWLAGAALMVGASVWLGLVAYRHVGYADELWWRFAWDGDASRFLRSSVAAAVALLALGAAGLVRRTPDDDAPEPIPDAVRRVVAGCADTEAALALLGDKRFLLAPGGDAFLMYRRTATAMIAKSDPMALPGADEAAVEALGWELLERADRAGLAPAFYAVGTRHLPLYLSMGLAVLKIGEVARVDLAAFTMEGKHRKELRYSRSRAERDGLVFEVVPPEAVPALLPELRAVSDAWLAEKAGSEKSFALGGFDEAYLRNFPHALMRRGAGGEIVAFANLWPGDGQTELSLDLMRHGPGAPPTTMNAMFAAMMLWGQARGYRWFNLGAAPFAGLSPHPLASRWNRIGAFVYDHGGAFYHFEGLRAFKEKFDPVWSPNYLVCPHGLAAARVLVEVNRLVSGGARGLLG